MKGFFIGDLRQMIPWTPVVLLLVDTGRVVYALSLSTVDAVCLLVRAANGLSCPWIWTNLWIPEGFERKLVPFQSLREFSGRLHSHRWVR